MSLVAAKTQMVGMAEICVVKGPGILNCLGLGSCIGLLLVDRSKQLAVMAHIMLPVHFEGKPVEKLGKFADTALPEVLRILQAEGSMKSRIEIAYAGGAHVFKFSAKTEGSLDVGARNIQAVQDLLAKERLRVVAHEVGGNEGRTMIYDNETGIVKVRSVAGGERTLCSFR